MKTVFKLLAGMAALAAPAALQAQTVQVNYGTSNPIPLNNDFVSQLNGLGLTSYATTGASLILSGNATIYFEFLGSESGYSDTFTADGLFGDPTLTENSGLENHFAAPIPIGFASFLAGSLTGLLNFTTSGVGSGGVNATVGQDGFAFSWTVVRRADRTSRCSILAMTTNQQSG